VRRFIHVGFCGDGTGYREWFEIERNEYVDTLQTLVNSSDLSLIEQYLENTIVIPALVNIGVLSGESFSLILSRKILAQLWSMTKILSPF
jgi:hypothetical protein